MSFTERLAIAFSKKKEPTDFEQLLEELIAICEPLNAAQYAEMIAKAEETGKRYYGARCIRDSVSETYRFLWDRNPKCCDPLRNWIRELAVEADGSEVAE